MKVVQYRRPSRIMFAELPNTAILTPLHLRVINVHRVPTYRTVSKASSSQNVWFLMRVLPVELPVTSAAAVKMSEQETCS